MERLLLLGVMTLVYAPVCLGEPATQGAEPAAARGKADGIVLLSGGNVREALRRIVRDFERQSGLSVRYRSGGSDEMLAEAVKSRAADLYVAADLRHVRALEKDNLVAAKLPLAFLRLAIIVKKGNPKNIRGLADLARPGVRVFLENPKGCQLATATRQLLAANKMTLEAAEVKLSGRPPTPHTAPQFIEAGVLDAAILWDSAAAKLAKAGGFEAVDIPVDRNVTANVVAVRFRFSPGPGTARQLMLFLAGPQARAVWAQAGFGTFREADAKMQSKDGELRRAAQRMIRASNGMLAPVYAPLAEQIVRDFKLADKRGIGIDVGSGPGTLIVELCKRTKLHWINADINPHFFPYFLRLAEAHRAGYRVSALCADAQALPFRNDYADVIVSRGSYHFWDDRNKGFAEIYRVLKPGGVGYIGRGFSRNLALDVARGIRARQGRPLKYDSGKEAKALAKMLKELDIPRFRIHLPKPAGAAEVSYGVWVELHKPR